MAFSALSMGDIPDEGQTVVSLLCIPPSVVEMEDMVPLEDEPPAYVPLVRPVRGRVPLDPQPTFDPQGRPPADLSKVTNTLILPGGDLVPGGLDDRASTKS